MASDENAAREEYLECYWKYSYTFLITSICIHMDMSERAWGIGL